MNEPEQLDLDLKADYGWFHVMRPRLMKGLIGEVGETAWAVYCVIKCHANHHTGVADVSQDRIAKLIGKSTDTVGRATRALIEAKLVTERLRGRRKEYLMLESAPITDRHTGLQAGSADFTYQPKLFADQIQAIKNSLLAGIPPGHGITLNLTVNLIQQRDNGTVNIAIAPEVARSEDAEVREFVRRLRDV